MQFLHHDSFAHGHDAIYGLLNAHIIEITLSVMKVDGHEVVQGIRASGLIEHHLLQHLCTSIAHSCAV